MTDGPKTTPQELERFLSTRAEGSQIEPHELHPRHLIAIPTTTEGGLENLDEDFDWDQLIEVLSEMEADEQSQWVRRLIRNLGSRTTAGIESEDGIEALGDQAYELRYNRPEVLLSFLDEVQSLLRYDTSSSGIKAAEDEFKRLARIGDRDSDDRIAQFREQDIEQRLVDPNLGAESRISLLESLAEDSLETVPSRMVVDVLYPLRNHYDVDVEKTALETLTTWAKELQEGQAALEAIETLEKDLANEVDELPRTLVNGILLSGYVGPAVIEWLVTLPRIEKRQEVVTTAFNLLRYIPGIRDSIEEFCTFLLRDEHEDAAVLAGIDVLESVLVGLEPHQNSENPTQEDQIQAVFFTEKELSCDQRIRSTLQTIVESTSYSDEVRSHAATAWLSVRPPEIQQVLWDIDVEDIQDNPITEAKLQAAAEHRLVEFVDVLEDLWQDAAGDPDTQYRLVDLLDGLESREIVDILLDPAFDADDSQLRDMARETLENSGYESEIERESQRRTVVERILSRLDAMSTATDIDREIRDRSEEQNSKEEQRKRAGVKAAEACSKSIDNITEFRTQGATQMLRLAPLFDQLEELETQIIELVNRIDNLTSEIERELNEAERIERQIKSTEEDIDWTENALEDAKDEKRKVEDRIRELDYEIIPDIKDEISQAEREFKKVERKEPKPRDFSGENWKTDYEKAHDKWEREMGNINNTIDSLRSKKADASEELSNLKSELPEIKSDISSYKSELQDLRSQHRELTSELNDSKQRIDGYEQRLATCREELQEIRMEYERVQSKVDDIVGELTNLQHSARSRESELQQRSEKFRSQVESVRDTLESLAKQQSASINRRKQQAEKITEIADQLDIDHEVLEDLGDRTKEEVPDADNDAIDLADEFRTEQYEENETVWRLDSIFRRVVEADRIREFDPEIADRAVNRVQDGGPQ